MTVLEDAERISGLPAMLSVFLDEYNRAKKRMNGDVYSLPVSGVNIKYDKDSLEAIVLTDTGAKYIRSIEWHSVCGVSFTCDEVHIG